MPFVFQQDQPRIVTSQFRNGPVGTVVVNQQQFQRGKRLAENALNGSPEKTAAIAHRHDDGNQGRHRSLSVQASGLMYGKSSTSRIDGESVKIITRRSMPIPSPAVGGIPYSSARI